MPETGYERFGNVQMIRFENGQNVIWRKRNANYILNRVQIPKYTYRPNGREWFARDGISTARRVCEISLNVFD